MITIDGGTGTILHNGVKFNKESEKMIDQWRRTSNANLNNSSDFLTTDWERVDGTGQGTCIPGGGMTESGGIFTFPTTGIYRVEWQCYFEETGSAAQCSANVYVTTDNSSYTNMASSLTSISDQSPYSYGNVHCQTLVDVTDTSQVKVKFRVYSNGSVTMDSSSTTNRNCATFTRIGDT